MKCPHCAVAFSPDTTKVNLHYKGAQIGYSVSVDICPECKKDILTLNDPTNKSTLIYPKVAKNGPIPPEIPSELAKDYLEACFILKDSPRSSAALARRCLQDILHRNGYKAKDLSKEIDALLNESDPKKQIPTSLRQVIDAIRNYGNFSAHPIPEANAGHIINVEPSEAEWCIEILDELFDHFYIKPAYAAKRKAELDAKLASANKPPSK